MSDATPHPHPPGRYWWLVCLLAAAAAAGLVCLAAWAPKWIGTWAV